MFRPLKDFAPRGGREHNRRRNDDRGRKYDADIVHTVQSCCYWNDAQSCGARYQWSSDYMAGNWPPHYPVPAVVLDIYWTPEGWWVCWDEWDKSVGFNYCYR